MKIRYKLILMFIVIITAASLPLSLYNLKKMESGRFSQMLHYGEINSRILAKTILNILLTSGGDIKTASIDAAEALDVYSSLSKEGVIYAGAVLVSSNKNYDGTVLASIGESRVRELLDNGGKISGGGSALLKHNGFTIIEPADIGRCYQFISAGSHSGMPLCAVRVIYSAEIVAAPVEEMKKSIYIATAAAVVCVSLLGLVFSRLISNPVYRLIKEIELFEAGNFDYNIKVTSRDEIGRLSNTFNHFLLMLKLQITELVSANRELRRLDILKNEFLANMTHELRSPIHGMVGIAESLIEGATGPVSKEAAHDLMLIVESGRRLSNLVNDILDFSKLKHSDIDLQSTDVDLYSAVQHVILITKPLLRRKKLKITNRLEPENSMVFADPERLTQIIMNLIVNAIKFTGEGGIIISSSTEVDTMTVRISDTGIGIPADRIERIFETFEQADGSTSRTYGGTGLGLAITRRLVELHGGRIWAVSGDPDGGADFYFTMKKSYVRKKPAAGYDFNQTSGNALIYSDTGIRMPDFNGVISNNCSGRILVVDDEPVNLQILINDLFLENYEVVTADNSFDALEIIESGNPPDLVLLDVMMPKISGYEVCRLIRLTKSLHDLPVLMLTAKNKTEDIVAGFEAGANDYLIKPVNRQELIARVNSLISLKKSIASRDELIFLKRDIYIAQEIQRSVLNLSVPVDGRFKIAARYRPMYEIGGDFYDIKMIDENRVAVLIADVSGHGIPAAIICAMLKVIFSFYESELTNPESMLTRINRSVSSYLGSQFITACYACIDLAEMKIVQANAGHWPLIVLKQESGDLKYIEENGIPLGWLEETAYENSEIPICPGDRIVLYTDFMVEARNSTDVMFGRERFHGLLKSSGPLDCEGFADLAMDTVIKWCALSPDRPLDDDATIIVIDILNR